MRRTAHYSEPLLNGPPRVISYSRGITSPTVAVGKEHPWQGKTVTVLVLIQMLFYFNSRKGFRPTRPLMAYAKEAKKLIALVGPQNAEKLMVEAYGKAKHPFGIAFLNHINSTKENPYIVAPVDHTKLGISIWGINF